MKDYVVLAVLLFAVFLLYSLLPRAGTPLTEGQARAFVVQDLSSLNTEARIVSSSQSGSAWEFDVLVTENPHSPCPTVTRRFYKLPPVSFRPEAFITSCYERNKLLFREEALINSAITLNITDGYGCAFKANAKFSEETAYCEKADIAALTDFASGLRGDQWVAFWIVGNNAPLLADLYENGTLNSTKQA